MASTTTASFADVLGVIFFEAWGYTLPTTEMIYVYVVWSIVGAATGVLGFLKVVTSNLSMLAHVGTPFSWDFAKEGRYKVFAVWYLIDAVMELLWSIVQAGLLFVYVVIWVGKPYYQFFKTSNSSWSTLFTSWAFYLNILMIVPLSVFALQIAVQALYAATNMLIYANVPLDIWVDVRFYYPWDYLLEAANDEALRNNVVPFLLSLEQLVLGNKRLQFYAALLMALSSANSPLTYFLSLFFLT